MTDAAFLEVTNLRTGGKLGVRIRPATSLRSRFVGLLGRTSLAHGEGLWLEPCASIHMFFMRFAIDAVFVDRAGSVTNVVSDLRPWRVAFGAAGSHAVIELPVGIIAASGTKAGDALRIVRHA